jgi:hypothetical protein
MAALYERTVGREFRIVIFGLRSALPKLSVVLVRTTDSAHSAPTLAPYATRNHSLAP